MPQKNRKVEVHGRASSEDLVVISLNQPANAVEKKVPEIEKALGAALGWTVNIIRVSNANGGSSESRRPRAAVKTLVDFITANGGDVVSSEEVTGKLLSQPAAVRVELVNVFGEGVQFQVELKPQSPAPSQAAIIALGTMLALSMLGLMAAVAFIARSHRKNKHQDSDRERLPMDQPAEGARHSSMDTNETFGKEQTRSREDGVKPDGDTAERQREDSGTSSF